MKIKTTMKICNRFNHVFRVGYCDLQHIFYGVDPVYYNAGVYGWNCDLYVDYRTDTVLTTGYRNMRGDRVPSELLNRFDACAREITDDRLLSYDAKMEKLETLRREFINELIAQ